MLKINKYFSKIPLVIFVFLLVFLYRLPSLGFDFINNDDGWWKSRGYAFTTALSNLDFQATAPTYHPGVTLLWSQFFAIKSYGVLNDLGYTPEYFGISEYFLNHFLQNFFVVFFTSILLSILYIGLQKIIGKFYAFAFIVILISEPFFTAMARTIHLDALLAITMFTSFVYYYLAVKNGPSETISIFKRKISNPYLYVAGFVGGLALLTKSPALFLFPFYFLPFLLERKKTYLAIYLKVIAVMFVTFVVLWPAMWVAPLETVNSYLFKGVQGVGIEEGHKHFWFGKEVNDPGFWFYPIILIGRFSSFLFIGMILGLAYLFKNFKSNHKTKSFYLYSFLYLLGYTLMVTVVSKKMDRYLLPAVFAMISIFIYYIMQLELKRKILKILLCTYLFFTLVIYYGIHPYYLVYYSPLIGGYDYGMKIIEPQWPVAYAKLADYFNSKKDAEKIKVALIDHFYIKEFAKFEALDLGDETERNKADYIVVPAYREDRVEYYTHLEGFEVKLADEIDVAGVTVYEVYKRVSGEN